MDDPGAILAADFGRVFCASLFLTIGAYSIWTITTYARKWHTHRNNGPDGNLPLHVWVVALSYFLLSAEAVYNNLVRLGGPPTFFIPYNVVSLGLGVIALFSLRRSQGD